MSKKKDKILIEKLNKEELIDEALLKNVVGGGDDHVNGYENTCFDGTGTDTCWTPCCFSGYHQQK